MMQYRKFGNTWLVHSALGFGMMRLQKLPDGKTDVQWAIDTLRMAIDRGLNYVDTAYVYGDSEVVTGLALRDGYREKVTLATKMPVGNMKCEEDFERILNEQLQRLQTDHIDCLLLHGLNRDRWENEVARFHVLEHAQQAKAEGKILHLGFSFHDTLDVFEKILNGYDKWEFCQIQLNYMDTNYQAGIAGLELAASKGLAVVIMEPLRGGYLANVTEDVAAMLPKSPVESALDFLWDRPEVSVVLSGMSTTEQVLQNLDYAEASHPGMLTEAEKASMLEAAEKVRAQMNVPCTGCNYCSVCPKEIAIPQIFKISNQKQLDGDYAKARKDYLALAGRTAEECVGCRSCVEQCPQGIDIPEKLAKIHKDIN